MTVLLVLFTIGALLLVDYYRSRKQVPAVATASRTQAPRLQPEVVCGFQVPPNVRFHPGHTWALSESPNLVRVGMDDFASHLLGAVQRVALPLRGQWVRQGQPLLTMERDGATVKMLSPMEGTVTDVNQAVLNDPDLARRDPYGDGWLVKVDAPDAKTSFRNLLGGSLARRWTEDAATRLQRRMPTLAGAFAQDGGLAADDLASAMPAIDRAELAREFFLV